MNNLQHALEWSQSVHPVGAGKSAGSHSPNAANAPVTSLADDIDIEEVISALQFIDADDYEQWFKVGMACKTSGIPLQVWDDWSAKSAKYEPGACAEKWKTIPKNSVTAKTIFKIAAAAGWDNPKKGKGKAAKKLERVESTEKGAIDFSPETAELDDTLKSLIKAEQDNVPYGYELQETGVYQRGKKEDDNKIRLTMTACWVNARNRTREHKGWGLAITFLDRDNNIHSIAIPSNRLQDKIALLMKELADEGLDVLSGGNVGFTRYLQLYEATARYQVVTSTGWSESNQLVYVTPQAVLTPRSAPQGH